MSNSSIPRTVAQQAPLFMGFWGQEYWSGLPRLLQRTFQTQGSKPCLLSPPLTGRFFTTSYLGSPCKHICVLVAELCLTSVIPGTVAHQARRFTEFFRQEYWSELPFPSPEDLPNP